MSFFFTEIEKFPEERIKSEIISISQIPESRMRVNLSFFHPIFLKLILLLILSNILFSSADLYSSLRVESKDGKTFEANFVRILPDGQTGPALEVIRIMDEKSFVVPLSNLSSSTLIRLLVLQEKNRLSSSDQELENPLQKKLQSIDIPGVQFFQTPLDKVIMKLQRLSQIHDKDEYGAKTKGVRFEFIRNGYQTIPRITIRIGSMNLEGAIQKLVHSVGWIYEVKSNGVIIKQSNRD